MLTINYCIALRKQGRDTNHIEKVLQTLDWSTRDPNLEMVKAALLKQDSLFYSLLTKNLKNASIEEAEVENWAIFDFYKNKPRFRELCKKLL